MAVPTDINSPLNNPSHTGEHQRVSDLLATAQSYPRGIVLNITNWKTPNPIVLTASVETTLLSANVSFTPVAGRRYRIVCQPHAVLSGATGLYCWLALSAGGVRLTGSENYAYVAGGNWGGLRMENMIVGDGLAKSYNFVAWSTQSLSVYCDGLGSVCYIEDVGV